MTLKNIFSSFNKNKKTTATTLKSLEQVSWSEIVKECYDKGLNFIHPIVKAIYTDDRTERAVILKKSDTVFTIAFEKLYPFDEDELKYLTHDLHGYWCPNSCSMNSIFDTAETATNAIFSDPPFKYNKAILWANAPFRIDAESLYWIKNDDADDPDDLCLHGHVFAKIGEEIFEYDATVSAAGLYLLRTLTDNHIIHDDQAMLPCCGHWMMANGDLSSVDIGGCPNGIDWSVIHEDGKIKLVTESGKETFIDIDNYREEVYTFVDKIDAFYKKCSPKNLTEVDVMSRDGYTAFWNEWRRCRL